MQLAFISSDTHCCTYDLNWRSLIFNLYDYLLDEARADEDEAVLSDKLHSLSSALYHLLPSSTLSAPVLKKIESIVPCLGVVFASYNIDTTSKDFIGEVEMKMGPFVVDKVTHFFKMMSNCSVYVKKNKKISKDLTHDLKFCIMGYIVVCWDVMIHHEEDV
ncbi:MAG: hypothetical protein ACXW33_08925 [Sulfuricurvum sp.]